MIYKRYGASYQSVDIDFDAKAITEHGFRRNRQESFKVDDRDSMWHHIETVELDAEAEGTVQTETKQLLLDRLRDKVEEVLAALPEGGMLLIENESGHDYPKSKQETKNVIVEGENRLYFIYTMAPALRLGLYRSRS